MKNIVILVISCLLIGVYACKKVNINGEYTPTASSFELESLLQGHMPALDTQSHNVDSMFADTVIVFQDSAELWFNPRKIVDASGTPAQGKVLFSYRRLRKKSDFIFGIKPTQSEDFPLISQSSYYLAMHGENGERYYIDSIALKVPVATEELDPEMELWFPGETENGLFEWQQESLAQDGAMSTEIEGDSIPGDTTGAGYSRTAYVFSLFNDSLGWINCDRFANYPEHSVLRLQFPSQDAVLLDNAMVFIVFKDINSVTMAHREDENNFVLNNIGTGVNFSVVAVAIEGIDVYSATAAGTVRSGVHTTQLAFQETTEEELVALISAQN